MTDDLAARVQRLEDRLEIHQLFIDYGLALDAGDFDVYAALFAEQGEVLLGPMGRGEGSRRDQSSDDEDTGGWRRFVVPHHQQPPSAARRRHRERRR